MKVMKYIAVLAIALFAFAGVSNAQTIQFLGGGSSALFLELGQAAVTFENTAPQTGACIWTANLTDGNAEALDTRVTPNDTLIGKIWVVWDKGTGTGASCATPMGNFNIYAYTSLDSVQGDRCYFATDSSSHQGCEQVLTPTSTEADTAGNLLGSAAPFADDASSTTCSGTNATCIIPSTVFAVLNTARWFVAGTDIRPEDAKFATLRALTSCTTTIFRAPFGGGETTTTGLGYEVGGASANQGVSIQSFYSSASFSVLNFNISGNDPFSGNGVRGYSVNTVGAQPIVVAVAPAGGTGLGAATDINTFTLTLFYNGSLARATDLIGPTANPGLTEVVVREPLSGTFNTFEYSVPNTNQFHTSQENANCNTGTGGVGSNPLNLQSANGETSALAARRRAIGTGEMTATIQGATSSDNRMGYFFWSAANASKFTSTNGKYLTVNGVDPLVPSYSTTNGVFPTSGNGLLADVNFANLNAGDYPIWSALRLVTTASVPAGVSNVILAAQTLNSTQSDFIPLSTLAVWHSHFALPQVSITTAALGTTLNTAGDLCNATGALAEQGGDAGGANVLKQANHDFCADFGNTTGLINASN